MTSATSSSRVGVLLVQLGTPDEPTPASVRRYLRQFLSDPRVIELPRLLWLPLLNLVILPRRSRASARLYRRVWSAEHGSPLRHYTERQSELLGQELGPRFAVAHAMRYGRPTLAAAVDDLVNLGCDRIVAVPLYPQYAASSTASALDELFRVVTARRVVPAVRVVPPFPTDEGYLEAVALRVREALAAAPAPPDHVVITFHGLPVAMVEKGDPYRAHCEATARQLATRLGLEPSRWSLAFQSRFGPARWLEPYTVDRLRELARGGVRRVLVVSPGFVADCLETTDEIGHLAAGIFGDAGGESLDLVPCLNDHPAWIAALTAIVRREASGW